MADGRDLRGKLGLEAVDCFGNSHGTNQHQTGAVMRRDLRIVILVAVTLAAIALAASMAPIAQDPTYHRFADSRGCVGIPNFLNVVSNVPFLLVGIWGLLVVFDRRTAYLASSERWPYTIFFIGVSLTFAGSSYYHLQPGNARLVWDRLPMALGFMGILSATLAERVSHKLGVVLLPLVTLAGVANVIYWRNTEMSGHGDLRPYLLVQFGSMLVVLVSLLLFPARYTHQRWLVRALALYAVAKLDEAFDAPIFAAMRIVSGHTIKHLTAAAAAYGVACMLRYRGLVLPRETRDSAIVRVPIASPHPSFYSCDPAAIGGER